MCSFTILTSKLQLKSMRSCALLQLCCFRSSTTVLLCLFCRWILKTLGGFTRLSTLHSTFLAPLRCNLLPPHCEGLVFTLLLLCSPPPPTFYCAALNSILPWKERTGQSWNKKEVHFSLSEPTYSHLDKNSSTLLSTNHVACIPLLYT